MTALFVLFGLLLNVACATGQLDRDPRSARLGNGETVRMTSATRIAGRVDDDGSDHDEALGAIPPMPQIVPLVSASHPAGGGVASAGAPLFLAPPSHYRARAPPVA
jgi:hypothetical protein